MTDITIYDLATGRIMVTASTPDASMLPLPEPGQASIVGCYPAAAYLVSDGLPVPFPPRPGDWAVWDWPTHTWTDPRDAAWHEAQAAAALAALRAERDARIAAVQWRLQRWRDETALGLTTTDDGAALLAYVQALRDLPETTLDPAAPVWPELPPER